jgi:hypothetical protein
MAAKMDLIVAGPANHVLAVAVRQDSSGTAPDATALVGEGLPIYDAATGDRIVTVLAEQLAVQSADLRDDVLMAARGFVIDNGLPEPGGNPAATPVQLDGTNITVNLPVAASSSGDTVWVYIQGAQQPIIHQVQVISSTTATEPLPLPPGPYGVLVLAPKVRGVVQKITVP